MNYILRTRCNFPIADTRSRCNLQSYILDGQDILYLPPQLQDMFFYTVLYHRCTLRCIENSCHNLHTRRMACCCKFGCSLSDLLGSRPYQNFHSCRFVYIFPLRCHKSHYIRWNRCSFQYMLKILWLKNVLEYKVTYDTGWRCRFLFSFQIRADNRPFRHFRQCTFVYTLLFHCHKSYYTYCNHCSLHSELKKFWLDI